MSDGPLPTTAARGIAVAAAVGALALAGRDVAVLVGFGSGLAFGTTLRGFGGSHRRVTASAASLPIPVFAVVAAIAAAATPWAGIRPVAAALVLAGVLVGTASALTVQGWPSRSAFLRSGTAALTAAVVVGIAAAFATRIDPAGGLRPAIERFLWLPGTGVRGLVGWVVLAGLAAAGGAVAVPSAALADPYRRAERVEVRDGLAWTVVAAAGFAVVALAVTALLARLVPPLETVLAGVTGSYAVRGLLAAIALSGVALAGVAGVARHSWLRPSGRENTVVPIVVGSGVGAVGCVAAGAGLGAGGVAPAIVAVLLGGVAVALGAGWLVLWWCSEALETSGLPAPPIVVAAALAGGGVTVAATSDATASGGDAVRAALPALVSIAAALFAYDVGRYGRTIGREIGLDGARRRPQLVRLGWSGAVAVVGVVVAAGGLWAATAFALTLSVPATVGVLVGVGGVLGAARLLLR